MSHTAILAIKASSVTFEVWQNGAKDKYCKQDSRQKD